MINSHFEGIKTNRYREWRSECLEWRIHNAHHATRAGTGVNFEPWYTKTSKQLRVKFVIIPLSVKPYAE